MGGLGALGQLQTSLWVFNIPAGPPPTLAAQLHRVQVSSVHPWQCVSVGPGHSASFLNRTDPPVSFHGTPNKGATNDSTPSFQVQPCLNLRPCN